MCSLLQLVFVSLFLLAEIPLLELPLQAQITASQTPRGVEVRVSGLPFVEYLISSGHQPAIWPIYGPSNIPLTRSFPVGPLQPGEADDHPHHRSLWFSHGDVNGYDFWHEPKQSDSQTPQIRHREFRKVDSRGDRATIVTLNDWIAAGSIQCEDERRISFGVSSQYRWIDFQIKVVASHGKVTFGDTKEGSFGLRVPCSIKLTSQTGGAILNSSGLTDRSTWGQPASWVRYSGSVMGQEAGITIMNHPSSDGYPTRWHVRDYGLFAANPFCKREFAREETTASPWTLGPGETVTFRYRILLDSGNLSKSEIDVAVNEYSKEFSDEDLD